MRNQSKGLGFLPSGSLSHREDIVGNARMHCKQIRRILKEHVSPIDKVRRIHCDASLFLDKAGAGPRIRLAKILFTFRLGRRNP